MTQKPFAQSKLCVVPIVLLTLMLTLQAGYTTETGKNLTASVNSLDLGMNGYVIGSKLSAAQKKIAADNPVDVSHEGTYKFSDNELFIVAGQDSDTVLAVYQRNEKANIDQARKMISSLMGLFGEPTTMAHDKLIYWAYNEQGKIPEEKYNELRGEGKKFDVLATVKFNSTFSILNENQDKEQIGTVYFIISSDPLTQDFIGH